MWGIGNKGAARRARDTWGARGADPGFTLIEVLVAVSLLAVGLAGILGTYQGILGSYKKARLLTDGLHLLEERITDQELEIRGGKGGGGLSNGEEGLWSWSTQTKETGHEGWYEIRGDLRPQRGPLGGEGGGETITLYRYVRYQP